MEIIPRLTPYHLLGRGLGLAEAGDALKAPGVDIHVEEESVTKEANILSREGRETNR